MPYTQHYRKLRHVGFRCGSRAVTYSQKRTGRITHTHENRHIITLKRNAVSITVRVYVSVCEYLILPGERTHEDADMDVEHYIIEKNFYACVLFFRKAMHCIDVANYLFDSNIIYFHWKQRIAAIYQLTNHSSEDTY